MKQTVLSRIPIYELPVGTKIKENHPIKRKPVPILSKFHIYCEKQPIFPKKLD